MDLDLATGVRDGQEAIAAGRWSAALESFRAVLERDEFPEALFGSGTALWWLGETEAALRHWQRAYATYRRRPDPGQAVLTAVYLCLAYSMSMGNEAAARGWLSRATRIVGEQALTDLNGWLRLCQAHLAIDAGHPVAAEGWAREAVDLSQAMGDRDLELCALSELGAALVEQGRVEDGAALLDEAMAAALGGEGRDLDAIVLISCRTITACSRGGEIRRASQWVRAADSFYERHGSPHLYTTCRTQYGGILFATGEWERAEHELNLALRIGNLAEPLLHAASRAKLAELRLAQGRLDDASRAMAGYEDLPSTAQPLAVLHLARGEAALAASLLRRRLRQADAQSVEASAVLELLAEAEVALGSGGQAARRAASLLSLAEATGNDLILARGERAMGRALLARQESARAADHLERALQLYGRYGMPFEAARTRLLLARAFADGDHEAAVGEARTALAAFERLGAGRDADAAAAFIRGLGAKAARGGPSATGLLTKREVEVLALLGEGLTNPQIGARLFITRKTVEHHVASVLAKIGLSGRGEAAAYAARHVGGDSRPN